MRRCLFSCIVGATFVATAGFALAQNSLQTLEEELKEAKQQHVEETTKNLAAFFSEIDAAMASPDAALTLYKEAKGPMPEPVPVVSLHDSETPTERDDRLALDQANVTRLATALQLHCGMMHFAALFVLKPNETGLQEQWVAWLQSAAQIYPQLALPPIVSTDPEASPQKKHHAQDAPPQGVPRPPPFYPEDLKGRSMRDSIISQYLAFKSWKDKEQGGWSVRDLPRLYKDQVLEPLRKVPTTDTLADWDVYIGLANADERDNNHWDDVVYPPLQFDRACDAYAVEPSTEKLEALVTIIKANPTYPDVDEWISRVSKIMNGYRKNHGLSPIADDTTAATDTKSDPNVNVTTEKQGDMTIVTTHTNSAPVAPPPPTSSQPSRGVSPVMNMQSVMNASPIIINPQPPTNSSPAYPTPAQ